MADLWDHVAPPQSTGAQIYEAMYPFSGCRAHSALHVGWDTDSLISPLGSQTNKSPIRDKYPAVVGQRGSCWEPWAAIWQGHCGLAESWQGQRLQVHNVSHWDFEETWSGSLCLEKRNIILKVFAYERPGTGQYVLGNQAQVLCIWN
jgi:hypothetical protein